MFHMSYTTPPPSHRQQAVDHLAAVEAARLDLTDLYESRKANALAVGLLNAAIRNGLAAAKVHATLAVADAITGAGNAPRAVLR